MIPYYIELDRYIMKRKEKIDAAIALEMWFRSQDLDPPEAVMVMNMLIEAITSSQNEKLYGRANPNKK